MRNTKTDNLTTDLRSIYEVAELLCVSVSTVHNWCERGYMPAPIDFGGRHRWRLSELKQWAANGFPHRELEPMKGTKAKT